MTEKKIDINNLIEEFLQNPPQPCHAFDCLDSETIFDFVYGTLPPEKMAEVKAHMEICEYTRWQVMLLKSENAVLKDHISKHPEGVHGVIADILGEETIKRLAFDWMNAKNKKKDRK